MYDPTLPANGRATGLRGDARRRVSKLLTCAIALAAGSVFADEIPVVSTSTVATGRLDRHVRQQVTLAPFEEVDVYAKATGYIEHMAVDIGDEVKAGQELARLDVPEMGAELLSAEAVVATASANVKRAEARLALRQILYKITEKLVPKGAKTAVDRDESGAERDIAEAELHLAQAKEKEAMARLGQVRVLASYLTIKAPFDGVVTQRFIDTGALIRSGSESGSRPLVQVQRTDKLRCLIEIPESDVIFVLQSFRKKTLSASFVLDALPDREFNFDPDALAKVVRFSHMVHPKSRHMIAAIDVENSDGLLIPGLSARLLFQALGLGEGDVVLVPNVAVQSPRRGRPYVFVVKAATETQGDPLGRVATVEKREIELGTTDGSLVEVLKGLGEGEEIVARGSGTLISGQKVKITLASNKRGRR